MKKGKSKRKPKSLYSTLVIEIPLLADKEDCEVEHHVDYYLDAIVQSAINYVVSQSDPPLILSAKGAKWSLQ